MTRAAFLSALGSLATPCQMLMMGEASEGFVSLFNGRDLGSWSGDEKQWNIVRGALAGKSEGTAESVLMFGSREYGDFELRLGLRVMRGAGRVRLHSRGAMGIDLEVGSSTVRWFVDGRFFLADASVRGSEWNELRIIGKKNHFKLSVNDKTTDHEVVISDREPQGKLALVMPAGAPSAIELRNIRIKE